ncbi:MAG: FkbM family methyltransferase [Phormidesmis sp.]
MKNKLKQLLSLWNLEIHNTVYRRQHELETKKQKTKWLENLNIKTVIDIGANDGDFAVRINEICPNAAIYSFEPLGDCYQQLLTRTQHISRFEAFNSALGEKEEILKFFRNDFTPSSSFLEMDDLHKQSFTQTQNSRAVDIHVKRLDSFKDKIALEKPVLLKIDVQGYEEKVIKGGLEVLREADILIVEASMVKLYKEQMLFDDMYKLLTGLGFVYQGEISQIRNPSDGRILQVDAIFIRQSALTDLFEQPERDIVAVS